MTGFLTGHGAYLRYELAWALPVIGVQWTVAGRELVRWRKLLTVVVTLSTAYLGLCDAIALGHGIWRIDPARTVGWRLGPLPMEELLFYFLTNMMASQGFVMLSGYIRTRRKGHHDSTR